MHVCADYSSIYTLIRKNFREWSHVNCKGNIPSTWGSEQGRTLDPEWRRTVSHSHYRLSYSDPSWDISCTRIINIFASGERCVRLSNRPKFTDVKQYTKICANTDNWCWNWCRVSLGTTWANAFSFPYTQQTTHLLGIWLLLRLVKLVENT